MGSSGIKGLRVRISPFPKASHHQDINFCDKHKLNWVTERFGQLKVELLRKLTTGLLQLIVLMTFKSVNS